MKKNDREQLPPYGEVAPRLLKSIFEALTVLYEADEQSADIDSEEINSRLYDCFQWIGTKEGFPRHNGKNPHLTDGFPSNKKYSQPRIVKLTKLAFTQVKRQEDESEVVLLPSPLKILLDILTVPSEPHSRAYALITCRNILFEYLMIYPKCATLPTSNQGTPWPSFTVEDITKAYSEILTYHRHRDNFTPGSLEKESSRVKLFLTHYLAMKSVLSLRFGSEKKQAVSKEKAYKQRKEYCTNGDLIGQNGLIIYEFRLSQDYMDYPNISEFINQIWGIPIPISNADTVFCGAMKPSSDGGLVISAHGKAGTGKTSFALAMAAALAPLGTKTYYITFEENIDDLKNRLHSLIPTYLRKLSFFEEDSTEWFMASRPELFKFDSFQECRLMQRFTEKEMTDIEKIIHADSQKLYDVIPKPCPLVVVVDSVSVLCKGDDNSQTYKALHDFVKKCRELNVLVILLSGENDQTLESLDYLVDTVIKLNYDGTQELEKKPVRILNLIKTRQQVSRAGAHIFHMSDGKGFRIAPQLPSQLDKQEKTKCYLPDQTQTIDVFNMQQLPLFRDTKERYLNIYPGSQILLHGHGSSGKAGLALKVLMTPPKLIDDSKNKIEQYFCPRRRILIVSFLYPDTYYETLKRQLRPQLKVDTSLEILSFYPGFYTPENFLSKILLKLENAVLGGEPFTGVLLDGLHNVFLQFPTLAVNTMIWPMLYNVLTRSKVTTVTTFTTFSIAMSTMKQDDELLIEGHKPFLHALVQASDFYIMLDSVLRDNERVNELHIKSALGQSIPSEILLWDKANLYFFASKPGHTQNPASDSTAAFPLFKDYKKVPMMSPSKS